MAGELNIIFLISRIRDLAVSLAARDKIVPVTLNALFLADSRDDDKLMCKFFIDYQLIIKMRF